jgi:hypothetical protein
MRTHGKAPSKSNIARFLFPALVICSALIPATAGAQDAAKTHTLFMGADVSVGLDKQLYAVRDVSGSSWVIDVDGKAKVVSARSGPIELKVTPSLKLTEISATVADLKAMPAFSLKNDPSTRLTQALDNAAELNAGYQAAVNEAQAALVHAQDLAGYSIGESSAGALAHPEPGAGVQSPAGGALNANAATARLTTALAQTSVSAGSDLEMIGDRGSSLGYEAMDVAFEVSSQHRLENPFVVTITRFHPRGTSPGTIQRLVYAKALGPIGDHPVAVHFYEEGFPPAFELQGFDVHLYNRGEEVATNVSPKRVELTRDEAFEYIKMEYISAHKGDTLAAVPVMGKLPADLPARLAEGKYGDTFYVKVSKDGLADEPFLDAACTKKVGDPYLESVVRNIRFKPALERGKPVDGVAPLKLSQLAI